MKHLVFFLIIMFTLAIKLNAQVTTYTALSGTITSNSTNTDYLIKPTGAQKVKLTFTHVGFELGNICSICVYDGSIAGVNNLLCIDRFGVNGDGETVVYQESIGYTVSIPVTSSSNSILIRTDWDMDNNYPTFTCTYEAITSSWAAKDTNMVFNYGNIGIGTLTPKFPLTVEKLRGSTSAKFGNTLPVYLVANNPNIGFNAYSEGGSWKFGSSTAASYGANIGFNAANGKLGFYFSQTTGLEGTPFTPAERFSILPSGYTGIGNNSPAFPLTVDLTKGLTNAKFGESSSVFIMNSMPAIGFNTYYNGGFKFGKTSSPGYAGAFSFSTANGNLVFYSSTATGADGASASMNYVFTLTNQGKLGLGAGMTVPTSKLSIKQTSGDYTEGIHLNSDTTNWYMYTNSANNLTLSQNAVSTGLTLNNTSGALLMSLGDYWTTGNTSLVFKTSAATGGYASIQAVKAKTTEAGGILVLNPEGGNILIGKTSQTSTGVRYKLDVEGAIRANEVVINTTGADFVFAPNYKLRPLCEVESFIKQNQHLPDVAPAADMQNNGVNISEMQTKLLQKVEELTLYIIELKKENESIKKKLLELKNN
jgi:hypothetical protein